VLDSITSWVTTVITTLGYAGVAFLVESVVPPIPSEVVLPLAGFVAGRGDASLAGMIVAATIGSVVGAWVLYGIAAWIGQDRLRRVILKYGGWLGVKDHDITRAEEWFDRRSNVAVAVGRCVPLIRSLVSIPAGFRRMPLVRFTILTAAGSLVWNAALIGAGAALGDNWEQVGTVIERFQLVVVVLLVAIVAWFLYQRLVKPRFAHDADSDP
jgi:membrane protein DedA with SNARE-associated domain